MARNPQGFGGDWRPRSGCLAEWGSTTGPQRGPGAEGGQIPSFACGSGHRCAAAASPAEQEEEKYGKGDHQYREEQAGFEAKSYCTSPAKGYAANRRGKRVSAPPSAPKARGLLRRGQTGHYPRLNLTALTLYFDDNR